MNIRVETAGPCRRQVHIEVPGDQVAKEFGAVAGGIVGYAQIPGFRAGHAPLALVKRKYAKNIQEEVKERLVRTGYQEAVTKEKLEAVAVLDVKENDLKDGQPFEFSVMLDVAPDFELPAYKGLKLESKKIEVEAKDVDDVIKNMREQNAKFEDVAGRAVQSGDMVQVDFEGTCEGKAFADISDKVKALGHAKDFWVMADPQNEFLPGFAAGILGANVGENRDVTVEFPKEFIEPAVAGKKADFKVSIKLIREKKLPEVDAEFLKSLEVENEAALRARIETDLADMRKNNERSRIEGEILKTISQGTKLDVPESLLAEETQQAVYDLVRSNTSRGVAKEDIEANKEKLFGVASQSAAERIKTRYILRKIAVTEGITANEQEINRRIAELAQNYRTTPENLEKDLEKNNQLGRVADEVRLMKTIGWLYDHAKIETT